MGVYRAHGLDEKYNIIETPTRHTSVPECANNIWVGSLEIDAMYDHHYSKIDLYQLVMPITPNNDTI